MTLAGVFPELVDEDINPAVTNREKGLAWRFPLFVSLRARNNSVKPTTPAKPLWDAVNGRICFWVVLKTLSEQTASGCRL